MIKPELRERHLKQKGKVAAYFSNSLNNRVKRW
jgi:hypothetical protein